MKEGEMGERLVARAILYRFLALLFYEPGARLVDLLGDATHRERVLAAAEVLLDDEGRAATGAVLEAFGHPTGASESGLRDLLVEYTRLFVGPAGTVCPPYESVYDPNRPADQRGTLLGPSAATACEAMQAEGLAVGLDHAELPDHVAIELEFMYYLLARASESPLDAETYIARAGAFCRDHLVNWLGEFGKRVAEQARHPFYTAAGRLLEQVIRAQAAEIVLA